MTVYRINSYYRSLSFNRIIDYDMAVLETEKVLEYSVLQSLNSDVPVGCLLSGGIDSSLIVATLNKLNKELVTYSLCFPATEYDESNYSDFVAKLFKTKHSKVIPNNNDIENAAYYLSSKIDMPIYDSSLIPTYLITKYASNDVKVLISGDGADEIFGGYNRYKIGYIIYILLKILPSFIKENWISSNTTDNILIKLLGYFSFIPNIMDKLNKIDNLIKNSNTPEGFYLSSISSRLSNNFNINNQYLNSLIKEINHGISLKDNFIETLMLLDRNVYLPNNILYKVDRASMLNSIEVRSPFLSKSFYQLSYKIPTNLKFKNGSKSILKSISEQYFPRSFIYKNKRGFGSPMNDWVRLQLRNFIIHSIEIYSEEMEEILTKEKFISLVKDHYNKKNNEGNLIYQIAFANHWINQHK